MSSDELASFTEVLTSLAQARTRGTGHDQYAQADGQQFEGMTPVEVAEYMLEELADVVNYAAMSAIKILAMARRTKG
jgi:acid stress-induced BolA-like protein IbaG/YrbA